MTSKLSNKVGPWVVDEDFFDRAAEVERLTQLIDENNNILLVAPRRIGKTSLIRETFRRMDELGDSYLLFVDVQDCKSPEDVIVALSLAAQPYRDLATKVREAFGSFLEGFRDAVESVGTSELLELRFREAIAGDWRAKAGKIVASLAEADRPVAICLDELPVMLNRLVTAPGDAAAHRAAAEVFLSWLRRTVTAYQDRVRWIICGSIGLEPILSRHNLSFTVGNLRPFHLPAWGRDTADRCLESLAAAEGDQWPEASRHALLDRLGGGDTDPAHFIPHHVQMYFAHVIDDCRMRGVVVPTPDDVRRVWETHMLSTRGHAELADYEERLLRVLDETAVDLALALLTETAVAGRLTAEAARRIADEHATEQPAKALRDVLRVLDHDGYLVSDGEVGEWRFVFPLVRDWWKGRFGSGYVPSVEE